MSFDQQVRSSSGRVMTKPVRFDDAQFQAPKRAWRRRKPVEENISNRNHLVVDAALEHAAVADIDKEQKLVELQRTLDEMIASEARRNQEREAELQQRKEAEIAAAVAAALQTAEQERKKAAELLRAKREEEKKAQTEKAELERRERKAREEKERAELEKKKAREAKERAEFEERRRVEREKEELERKKAMAARHAKRQDDAVHPQRYSSQFMERREPRRSRSRSRSRSNSPKAPAYELDMRRVDRNNHTSDLQMVRDTLNSLRSQAVVAPPPPPPPPPGPSPSFMPQQGVHQTHSMGQFQYQPQYYQPSEWNYQWPPQQQQPSNPFLHQHFAQQQQPLVPAFGFAPPPPSSSSSSSVADSFSQPRSAGFHQ